MIDLQTLVAEVPFVFFDVETTGFSPTSGDRVVDISLLRWENGDVTDDFGTLVSPLRSIPRAATEVHGISDHDVIGAPVFGDIADEVFRFIAGTVIVGHNVEFDLRFLNYELAIAGKEQWNGIGVDTLSIVRRLYRLKHNKLIDIAQYLGLQVSGEHRATADAWTTSMVFQRIVDQACTLSNESRGTSQVSLQDIIRMQKRPVVVPTFAIKPR